MPLISRGVPAYASSGLAGKANDTDYLWDWRSSGPLPQWLAYDLSGVPADRRGRALVAWYNGWTYNYDGNATGEPGFHLPMDYTIEANAAPGGTSAAPTSGWVALRTVTGEKYHSRQFALDLTGYNWVRIHVTATWGGTGGGTDVGLNLDVHDASAGYFDSWIVYGDSIAANGLRVIPIDSPSTDTWARLIEGRLGRTPAQEQGAWAGMNSSSGVAWLDTWLPLFPGQYVILAWGTNDANGQVSVAQFKQNLLTMVDKVQAAGKTPVLGTIPWARTAAVQANGLAFNQAIAEVRAARPGVVAGPDL